MNIKKHSLILAVFSSIISLQTVQAQSAAEYSVVTTEKEEPSPVVTISKVTGRTLVDLPNGQRLPIKSGMDIPEDARILVWSKSVVEGVYNKSKCKFKIAPGASAGSTLNIKEDRQCATAISVINPEKFASFFDASNPGCCVFKTVPANSGVASNPGCCIVRTITIPATPIPLPPVNAVASAIPLIPAAAISSINPLILAGLAAGATQLLPENGGNPQPISPQ